MNKKTKIIILVLVALSMVGIYANESIKGPSADEHDHSVSQLAVLEDALDDELPIMIEFVTHT